MPVSLCLRLTSAPTPAVVSFAVVTFADASFISAAAWKAYAVWKVHAKVMRRSEVIRDICCGTKVSVFNNWLFSPLSLSS